MKLEEFNEVEASLMEHDLELAGSGGGDGSSRVSNNERSEEVGVRVWNESDGTVNKETESRVLELRDGAGTNDVIELGSNRLDGINDDVGMQNNEVEVQIHRFDGEDERMEQTLVKIDRNLEAEKFNASHYKSLLSEFDDFVANEKVCTGTSWAMSYGFEVGDMATVFSLRKALFEEYDETYAQAFGVQPSRPSVNVPDQLVKQPSRAPLSGPLVIAEALGSGKSSKKSMKVKENLKRDRYLFKRRDEPSYLSTDQLDQGQLNLSSPPAYVEGPSTGDYVLQKRAPACQIPVRHEQAGYSSKDGADISSYNPINEIQTVDHALAYSNFSTQSASPEAKLSVDTENWAMDEVKKERMALDMDVGPPIGGSLEMPGNGGVAMVSYNYGEIGKLFRSTEGYQHSSGNVEYGQGLDQIRGGCMGLHPLSIGEKQSGEVSADVGVKKESAPKRPFGDLIYENSAFLEQKKKKKKKDCGLELNSDYPLQKKSLASGNGATMGSMAGKSNQFSSAPREDSWVDVQKKDVGSSNSLSNSMGTFPTPGIGNNTVELTQLLSDLQAIALDPFYGVERNTPAIIRHCFLRFRSLVYQKSLVFSPPPDYESVEVHTIRSPCTTGALEGTTSDNVKDVTHSKPLKAVRTEDPTKSGRKRLPSDRQEEMAAKRVKKIDRVKALTVKKVTQSQRLVEAPKAEGKEQGSLVAPVKSVKPLPVRKMEPTARVAVEPTARAAVEPTMLVMKFPPCTSLPSVAELKAKFGRFRSLDQSAIRVFWKSSTVRVVFRHKADAEAAFKYVKGNTSLFGNVEVTSYLRTMEAPVQEGPESNKPRADDTQTDPLRIREAAVELRLAAAVPSQPIPQAIVQLKSCLKKPTAEDSGQVIAGSGNRGTTRVKFMLGGEESNRGDQLNRNNFNNNNNNNPSFADGAASSSSIAMEFNRNNFQKVIPPSPSPVLHTLPPLQFPKPPLNNLHLHHHHHHHHHHHNSDVSIGPRNSQNVVVNPQIAPTPPVTVDISQQMLSLLTRCNDLVSNVTGMLGYVPYHPL
ncbi:uncharacterized protein LOC110815398 [Carica papaya]|uniref:uncharacterized protein LOC110815398 n=1 Tax=Carica papaya TaxID=3649 RepID=UPI000B8CCB6B|nr:uncharacterized protein LOC110815398 [Carica papaya]